MKSLQKKKWERESLSQLSTSKTSKSTLSYLFIPFVAWNTSFRIKSPMKPKALTIGFNFGGLLNLFLCSFLNYARQFDVPWNAAMNQLKRKKKGQSTKSIIHWIFFKVNLTMLVIKGGDGALWHSKQLQYLWWYLLLLNKSQKGNVV